MLLKATILSLLLGACAHMQVAQDLNPKVYYALDQKLTVNKEVFRGAGVASPSEIYNIEVESPGTVDMIKVTTCHRQFSTEDPKRGWFENSKKYKFKYRPMPGVEDVLSCPVFIEAYEKGVKSRHSAGMVAIMTKDAEVPAIMKCNGEEMKTFGVSLCHSWEGLWQEIVFPSKVVLALHEREKCKMLDMTPRKVWQFRIPNRECTYIFKLETEDKFHRLITVGYEEIAIRDP